MLLPMRVRKYHILEGYMRWWAPQLGKKFDSTAAAESLAAAKSPERSHNLAALVKGAGYDRKTD
jgi:hypothetical protein